MLKMQQKALNMSKHDVGRMIKEWWYGGGGKFTRNWYLSEKGEGWGIPEGPKMSDLIFECSLMKVNIVSIHILNNLIFIIFTSPLLDISALFHYNWIVGSNHSLISPLSIPLVIIIICEQSPMLLSPWDK